jgi:hypothetical protein
MSDAMHSLLTATPLLDLHHPDVEALVARRGWRTLSPYDRIGAVYDFVRNEVAFGYDEGDELPASRVLADGIGQCNTKSTLLMALLRAVGIPCLFHGFTIDKRLQKGAITGLAYLLAPQRIIHSWVEVSLEGRWIALEGCISMPPTWPACSAASPRRAARRPASSGVGRTPTSRRKASRTTSVSSTARMPSTRATVPTCRASNAGCTNVSSATR